MIKKTVLAGLVAGRYGKILLGICLMDLTGTALGVHFSYLTELNPMLNYFLVRNGLSGLIIAKMFFVVVPILIFEISLKINLINEPKIKIYYRIVISSYVLILTGSILFQIITA